MPADARHSTLAVAAAGETIIRNDNDNTIRGTDGVDTLVGMGGNDTYYLTEGDTVVE